jgi:DNA-binding IclR family transcriptional regulator
MSAAQPSHAPSVERALQVLEVLADAKNGLTLSELSRRLQLPKSSMCYVLATLMTKGYLQRNQKTSRYTFGLKVFSLAHKSLRGIGLRQSAAPLLWSLMEKSGLTVHLAVLDDDEAVLVEKVEPLGAVRLATWVGKRMDLHCTGVGKAILAYLPDEDIDRLCKHGFTRYNDNTITSSRRIMAEIARIRKLGYAFEDEEGEIGFRCVGAPILDEEGKIMGGVSLAGNTSQITAENLPWLAEAVKKTAESIAKGVECLPAEQDSPPGACSRV